MHKATLRQESLQKRKLYASMEKSAMICEKAATLPVIEAAKSVMVYISAKSEVETALLIATLLKNGKTLCAPRVLDGETMEAARIDDKGFQKGAFGIWEPLGKRVEKIDAIFVPGVCFDPAKNRIGYGKGYYDRFLSCSDVKTIGLAFACQIVPSIPFDAHDKPLDMIVTEDTVYA